MRFVIALSLVLALSASAAPPHDATQATDQASMQIDSLTMPVQASPEIIIAQRAPSPDVLPCGDSECDNAEIASTKTRETMYGEESSSTPMCRRNLPSRMNGLTSSSGHACACSTYGPGSMLRASTPGESIARVYRGRVSPGDGDPSFAPYAGR